MDEYEDIIGSLENEEEIIGGEVLDDEETTGEMTDDQFDMSLTNNHALLSNRSAPNQHPISSITGLEEILASLADNAEVMSLINALTGEIAGKVADAEFDDDGLFYFLDSYGERIAGPFEGFKGTGGGGGGGGSSNNAVLTVTNTSGWLATTVAEGAEVAILLNWTSLEDDLSTGNGSVTVFVNGANKASLNVAQGDISIDVTNYLVSGTNNVRLRVSDAYGNIKTIQFTINVAALSIESSFDATTVYSDAISFPFVPKGNVSKTIYFEIDGTLDGTMENVTASNRQLSYSIPSLSHGEHILRVWFEAEVNGETVSSNVLRYSIVFAGQTGNPVISSDFNRATVQQYESVPIRYQVYNPTSMSQEITIAVNGTVVSTQTVDRTLQTYTFRADNTGAVAITITAGVTTKTISFTVAEGEYTIEAETEALELYLSPNGRSNNESTKNTWAYGNVSATMTGFNFASDGWLTDEKDVDILRVTGDARVTIPFQPFASDFRTGGKTIELDFLVRDVRDYDTVIMSCMSGNRGFELTAQKATMKSAQTEIFTQYKEDEHVRIAFVVEKRSENRLVYIYINGIMSGVVQYPSDDDFAQVSPVNISIGSSYCTTDIYGIRIYNNDLTRHQIVTNWIADTQDVEEKVARYTHNNVYNEYAEVTISDLPNDLPYLVIRGTLPTYKGDKKTVSGYYTDPQSAAKSFTYENAQIDVQGTSSQYYSRKNYKIKFNGGFTINGETQSKYQMRSNSVPTKTFCMKADVASSEGANNVELARRYEAACPYKTPPQLENPQVRQGIDGFPIVIFHDDGENIRFIGKYNWNNDKSTEEVFGFSTGDESWETLNNTSDRVIYKSADFTGDGWLNDFEARYPDTDPAYTNKTKLSAFAAWVVSTDRDAVQSAADKAARLAKFKSELADHANVDSALFYYIFTELFLMVDSRAKNSFPTRYNAEGKWIWLPYDLDTALGINNEGSLVFGYELEDTDLLPGGAKVFNGQDSTFWCNIRDAYADEIRTMYQTLRSTGALSYEVVENAFKEHQSKWPEAIFNEDAYVKYIEPLITEGNGVYLAMCQGSKEQQREWWLSNRFKYMDSKYNAGEALSKYITVRGYAKDDITVTPYAHIYAAAKFGSYLVQERAIRGGDYTLECPLDNVNDTEIMIFSADQLASVGDLSGLKVGFADFSMGTKLQSIKVGDGAVGYTNPNLTELYVGNNTLLKEVDARNCTALTGSVDLSGCTNVEEVYMEGTALTGLQLPNGGALKKLHLPGTITNLTIRNQPGITEFVMPDYSNISTLWIENAGSAIDPLAILAEIEPGSRVRIIGFNISFSGGSADSDIETLYDLLDTMRGLDEQGGNTAKAQVSGTIHVDNIIGSNLEDLRARYPNITIDYTYLHHWVRFYNYDGTFIGGRTTGHGQSGSYSNDWATPSRPSTAENSFTFVGWALSPNQTAADPDALTNVIADRNVYAAFSITGRTYTVYFYNGSTLLQTSQNIPYGGSATYTGATPTSQDGDFVGWNPSPTNITGDTSCYAQFGGSAPTATDATGAYGVEWDYSSDSPALTRKGLAANFTDPTPATSLAGTGSSPFDNILPWSGMKRYNVINGEVAYSEDDAEFDAEAYDTVVYIPEFYYTAYKDTTNSKWLWAISPTQLPGYEKHPGSGRYVGRYHTSGSSAGVFSKSGAALLVRTSQTNFRTYSHNKGTNWYMLDLASWAAIQMLYLVEFANFNSQTTLGTGYAIFNSGDVCGGTDSAAYHTLKISGTHNQYRWIEDPYSNCMDWIDGFVGGTNATYAAASDTGYSGSTTGLNNLGFALPASGTIMGFGYSANAPWALIPNAADANDTTYATYVCDKMFSGTQLNPASVGGRYSNGMNAGFFHLSTLNSAGAADDSAIGSRLLYIPAT